MSEYNKLQIYYIQCFAKLMNIKNEDKAALQWVELGMALKFSEQYRLQYETKTFLTRDF